MPFLVRMAGFISNFIFNSIGLLDLSYLFPIIQCRIFYEVVLFQNVFESRFKTRKRTYRYSRTKQCLCRLQNEYIYLDHFLFKGVGENGKTGAFLHSNVSYDKFMEGISKNNYFNADVNVTVLDLGATYVGIAHRYWFYQVEEERYVPRNRPYANGYYR